MAREDVIPTMLEDHLGDILRKARSAWSVPSPSLAAALALSESELTQLEASGTPPRSLDFSQAARLLRLCPKKLEEIANGWEPKPIDLSRWESLHQITTTRRGNAVHCYLIWDPKRSSAILFDTGWEAAPIIKFLADRKLRLSHLFLTHSHEDHIAALSPLRVAFPEAALHTSSASAPPAMRNQPGTSVAFGSWTITAQEMPGHAEDGVLYFVDGWRNGLPRVVIAGDTLFAGSIARGFISTENLLHAIRTHLLPLPDDTLLCPGHGPLTTPAEERAHNPFF